MTSNRLYPLLTNVSFAFAMLSWPILFLKVYTLLLLYFVDQIGTSDVRVVLPEPSSEMVANVVRQGPATPGKDQQKRARAELSVLPKTPSNTFTLRLTHEAPRPLLI
jgi:hypothetical protein